MLKNHLKIAFRQLSRNKVFSGINILGLSLGMALAVLIAVFIKNEFSYDHWMEDSEYTYRVYRNWGGNGTIFTPPPLANRLARDYPEIVHASGFAPWGESLIEYAGNAFYLEESARVDSTFFEVMSMPFLHGDYQTALDQPNSLVMTDRLATRLFANQNPLGEVLKVNGTEEFIITGILDTKDKKSHIIADVYTRFRETGNYWTGNNRFTYVRVAPPTNIPNLEDKITADISELIKQEYLSENYTPTAEDIPGWKVQPLNDLYLDSDKFFTMGVQEGSMENIYILSIIGLLVLLVAIVNYINLTTARASQRSKEVGVKKVTGAGRGLLTTQFITESLLQAVVAGAIAILIAEIGLPFFNMITGREMQLLAGDPTIVLIGLLVLSLLTGLLAGAYPAFVMAAYKPVTALKSNFLKAGDKGLFRKVLVTGQFAITITLLIVMAFVYRQVNFMIEKDLGFSTDQVLNISMNDDASHRKLDNLKVRFKNIPGVQEITTASHFPGRFLPDWGLQIEGQAESENPFVIFADEDFANTLNIEMVAGRFLDKNIGADSVSNFVVNETFVRQYNIETPIGKRIKFTSNDEYGQIVGVMKDFHTQGVQYNIRPLVMNARHWRNHVGIKLATTNISNTVKEIEKIWAEIEPHHPMRYTFLDEEFTKQYEEHQRFGKTILYATLLTLFIALLGLFGLTAFTVERRTREIGIRKVLGASVAGIIGLLAKDFMKLVVIASLIAIPISYELSCEWLKDFAHQTNLVWWVFAGAGLLILVVGFMTVALQSVKAALTNPIKSLRSE